MEVECLEMSPSTVSGADASNSSNTALLRSTSGFSSSTMCSIPCFSPSPSTNPT
jgi:hypothetical protein